MSLKIAVLAGIMQRVWRQHRYFSLSAEKIACLQHTAVSRYLFSKARGFSVSAQQTAGVAAPFLDVSRIHHQKLCFSASVLENSRDFQKNLSLCNRLFWITFVFIFYAALNKKAPTISDRGFHVGARHVVPLQATTRRLW
jgi:hypothetical protein